jgi:hypothetical protein
VGNLSARELILVLLTVYPYPEGPLPAGIDASAKSAMSLLFISHASRDRVEAVAM